MSDKLSDERLRELLIGMSVCADFEESALMGEDAESLAAALDELLLLRRTIEVSGMDFDNILVDGTTLKERLQILYSDKLLKAAQ